MVVAQEPVNGRFKIAYFMKFEQNEAWQLVGSKYNMFLRCIKCYIYVIYFDRVYSTFNLNVGADLSLKFSTICITLLYTSDPFGFEIICGMVNDASMLNNGLCAFNVPLSWSMHSLVTLIM